MDLRFLFLLACFVLSGASALVFETVWTEELALVFGASELALVSVLAAYMTGLAAGAAAGARWARRVARPLLAYAVIELAIGLAALAVPAAIAAAGRLEVMLLATDGVYGGEGAVAASTLFQLASSFLILLLPTALMGATLPLLVRHAVRREEAIGARVGSLYAANTLGAATGAVVTAFVLLPSLGLGRATLAGVALNGCVALLAGGFGLASPPLAAERARERDLAAADRGPWWPLAVVAVSGAVALGCEIVWMRLLTHLVGGSVYALGTMLAAFLVAIALGAAAAAGLARTRERARLGLALAQLGAAALSLVAFAAADRVPDLTARLAAQGASRLAVTAVLGALLILPGALCLGASFPLAVRVLAGDARQASLASGRALAWNTLGAVAGTVATGLWLLPGLAFAGAMALAAAVSLGLAAVVAVAERPRLSAVLVAAVLGLGALAFVRPPTPWHVLRSSPLAILLAAPPAEAPRQPSGEATEPAGEEGSDAPPPDGFGEVVYYGVGRGATVLLHEDGAEWRLTGNGLPESAVQPPGGRPGRYAVARWLTLLPGAVREEVRELLVIGLGAGHSIEELPPSIEEIHVVELEPEMIAANRYLASERRRDPLADPRLALHVGDVRSVLSLSRRRFDAIVSQPSHPWTSGSSHLFTREFFELARAHLAPGGVFVQWIGLDLVDAPLLQSLVATLAAAFPHVEVYQPHPWGAVLFAASDQPLGRDGAPFLAEASAEAWRALGVSSAEDLVLARVLDDAGARLLAAGAELNTDRRNLLQTRSPRALAKPVGRAGLDRLIAPFDSIRRLPPGADGVYVVRWLARQRQQGRALRAAAALSDAGQRHAAFLFLDLAAGRRRPAEPAVAAEPSVELRSALLLALRPAIVEGRGPAPLLAWAEGDPAAGAVVAGWRLAQRGEEREMAGLEAPLAAVPPRHPLHQAATRLRIAWRLASGEPQAAREAVGLLDPLLAGSASAGDLLLRARLGAQAGDAATALASLDELARATVPDRGRRRALAEEGLAVLEALPPSDDREVRERLKALLEAQAAR